MSKTKNKKLPSKFHKILSFILIIITVLALSILFYFKVIPKLYLILGTIIISIIVFLIVLKLNIKTKARTKIICLILSILFIIIELIGIIFAFGTIDFFNDIFDTGLRTQSYGIYVLNDSTNNKIKDLKNSQVAVYDINEESINKITKKLNNKVSVKVEKFTDQSKAINQLLEKEKEALIINESYMNIYIEEHDSAQNIKLLDTIEITSKNKSEFKSVNITKKPFVAYISGVDTTGSINKTSRSDVNILVVVNPVTGRILILNTPRDYYIDLATKNAKDKLTHAGIYGIEESAKSLGLLYDVDINYYARVNFTSFTKIIDTLDGIKVDVEKPDYRYNQGIDCGKDYICEQNSNRKFGNKMIYIKSGTQTLNGEQALAYARNRYQYSNGDYDRQIHQQQVLKACLEKILSPKILTKYNALLKSLSSGVLTNVEQKPVTKLVNYQLDEKIKWNIETINVTGSDDFAKTYSTGNTKVYVIKPNENSILKAKSKIKEIMEV